jgi:two-component system, cell cycle response regulator
VVGVDGVVRTMLDRLRPRREPDGTLYFDGVTRDVTERRRLEDDLRRSMADMEHAHRQLDAAHRAAEHQARTDDLTGTYNRRHFSELVTAQADLAGCALLLLDADHFKQINDRHGHTIGDAVLVELARRLRAELADGELLSRWGGEEFAVLLREVGSDEELRRRAERLREVVRTIPMLANRTTIHLTVSIGGARHPAAPIALDAWIDSADHALYAAKSRGRDRVCLAADVRAVAERPEDSSVTLARGIAFAAALRADESEAHAAAVAELSAQVAERLGLPAGMVMRCRLGGWLHDVGKIAIPDAVLRKPGALSADEWAVMRTHPIRSEEVVKRIASLCDTAAGVRHHHERFDGTGYPDRLAGQEIPIEARIIAAADAYCAMTTDRVYSTARSPADAADELRRSAGTHFDPQVVDALLDATGSTRVRRPAARSAA